MRSKSKIKLALILCVFIYFVMQFTQIYFQRSKLQTYNGVITAFQFIVCLMTIKIDYKRGRIVSLVCLGFSFINLSIVILAQKNFSALPGLCNTLIYIVTVILLSFLFQSRMEESVTDLLTGLKNRRGLLRELNAKVEDRGSFYVLYIDLGNFKFINDNYGHSYGDQLLKIISKRLLTVIDKKGTVSRIGGAEFVIVISTRIDIESLVTQLLNTISEKVTIQLNSSKTDSYLTSNIGISRYPQDANTAENLIKFADIAMYQSIKNKKERYKFFDKSMEETFINQMELEKLVNESLIHDYFYIDYQPQYEINRKQLRGFEALLRMKTPDGTIVSPKDFIPVAEKSDLILKIDDYVLKRVMREFKDIVSFSHNDIVISINVSASNVGDLDFVNKINHYLKESGFPPENLEIEITEYCLVRSVETTIDNIKKLHDMGIRVAIDDFGTGYTSLSYLSKMPVHLLKIDKSLIDDIEEQKKNRDFVNAVISMGHLMGCKVISEGVENENQLNLLEEQQCDYIQGFVWSKPISYREARDLALN